MAGIYNEKIKELRKEKGISQKRLAEILEVAAHSVSAWESGKSLPSAENLFKISKVFEVPIDIFFESSEDTDEAFERSTSSGMESLIQLYKIGRGPSSSHTMGPEKACLAFKKNNPSADSFKAILYGSLAKTGKGHGTDYVIKNTFLPTACNVVFNSTDNDIPHPNTMDLIAYSGKEVIDQVRVMSIGGGSIQFLNSDAEMPPILYKLDKFKDIAEYCRENRIRLWQYAEENEDEDFWDYMQKVWNAMKGAIERGLNDAGILPGGLGVNKKAGCLYNSQHIDESAETRENRMVCSFAFAVSEQNASFERIVTAPTCGAAGVVPAVLYYQQQKHGFKDSDILKALATGGIIGNLIKTNASISGAECGCQAEVGTACAMAAAALGELFNLNIDKIEYAAEIAIEHHLGLTCDPICGLVQIPCIERNAVASMRAINAVNLASFLSDTRKISLDKVIIAMRETGRDLAKQYKETSEGGLANITELRNGN